MYEFQVHLGLPVEAESIQDAVEEFRWDVANGPAYVYGVDTGDALYSYDTETGEVTPAERIDKGTLDTVAARIYNLAHDLPSDQDGIDSIRAELYKLLGMV